MSSTSHIGGVNNICYNLPNTTNTQPTYPQPPTLSASSQRSQIPLSSNTINRTTTPTPRSTNVNHTSTVTPSNQSSTQPSTSLNIV